MTKTPEELAEQKVNEICQSYAKSGYDVLAHTARIANEVYLAGYEAAKPKWISVKERLPEPDTGPVLVAFLEPFFGGYKNEIGVGYYDSPESYEDPEDGSGWRFWIPDKKILGGGVTHWMPLPEAPKEKPQATAEANNVGLGASAIDSGEKNLGITREMEDVYLPNSEEE